MRSTAEDVGKFPDKNLAEALQRVPGIVINRDFGEGERVNLRGTGPNLTRTLLNGHALATADWFILDQLNTTRSFNYLMLPADVIGQVEVYKSPQADFEEGGIGGTIDVVTRNPLDLESMPTVLSAPEAPTRISRRIRSAVLRAVQLEERRRAPSASWSPRMYQKRNIRRDGVEVLGYDRRHRSGPATRVLVPSLIGSALFQQERVRNGRQLRHAVPAERRPRHQRHRPVLEVRGGQHSTRTTSPGARARSATAAR